LHGLVPTGGEWPRLVQPEPPEDSPAMQQTPEVLGSPDAPMHEIATAPGDLPPSEIRARIAMQRGQFRHDNLLVPLAPRADQPVEVWAVSGLQLPLGRAVVYYTLDGQLPDHRSDRAPMVAAQGEWDLSAGYLTRWRAILPPQSAGTIVRYRIGGWSAPEGATQRAVPDRWAQDGQGFWFRYPPEEGITTFAYRLEDREPALPEWTRDAVIYQIFLDRFHPGTPDGRFPPDLPSQARHGGSLRGVLVALPYLAELGVTCLLLSPVCEAESYHRYDTVSLYSVDPELGGGEDLARLTAEAHAVGMRVLLDFVPSHCSWHHPAFLAARRDRDASTATWFTFEEWPDRYRSFLDSVPSLPSWNTEDPGAREHIIGSAVQWLRDYHVDGFRLDHAIAPGMDFWVAFREATRAAAPEVLTIGEATDSPDCLRRYRGRLDGILDFQLAGALRLTFATHAWDLTALDAFLDAYDLFLAEGPGRISFLDNHDMDRFLYLAENDRTRLKLAALCQFSLAPTPVIYYGTEIGMDQPAGIAAIGFGGDVLARADMPWDPREWDQDLLAFYRALTRARRDNPALRAGGRHTAWLDAAAETYAYWRTVPTPDTGGGILAAFNLGAEPRTLTVPAPGPGPYRCALSTAAQPELAWRAGLLHLGLPAATGVLIGG